MTMRWKSHRVTRLTRWFEVDVQPLKSASDIVGIVVLSIDVTERRRGKHPQHSGDPRLLALTEHARDIITVAAPDGTVQYVSGGVRNSLGYTSEERQSHNLFDHVHPDDHDVAARQVSAVGGRRDQVAIRGSFGSGTRMVLTAGWSRALPPPWIIR